MSPIDYAVFLIAAFATISGFYIQGQEYISSMVKGQLVQSSIIALISFILAYYEHSIDLLILGILIAFLRGFLITYFLDKRVPGRMTYVYESNVNVASLLLIDLAFIVVGIFIIYSIVFTSADLVTKFGPSSILVFPLSLFFQGLFLIGSRRSTFSQIIGYIEEENSLVLFALFLVPVPIIIEASVFLDVLALVVISSILVIEKFRHYPMEELRG
jgi:hydrogenase-4 component E